MTAWERMTKGLTVARVTRIWRDGPPRVLSILSGGSRVAVMVRTRVTRLAWVTIRQWSGLGGMVYTVGSVKRPRGHRVASIVQVRHSIVDIAAQRLAWEDRHAHARRLTGRSHATR